jgi:hypothetical protein
MSEIGGTRAWYVAVQRLPRSPGAVGTVKLKAVGTSTHMTVTIRSPSREHMDQFVRLGVDAGTAQTLDNLGSYVARLKNPA